MKIGQAWWILITVRSFATPFEYQKAFLMDMVVREEGVGGCPKGNRGQKQNIFLYLERFSYSMSNPAVL